MPHSDISDPVLIEKIIRRAEVCQVAFSVDNQPYVVPMNFGYEDGCFYFHSKASGKKLDCLDANPRAAFSLQTDVRPLHEADNCSMVYLSVIGSGTAQRIHDRTQKQAALDAINRQYHLSTPSYSDAVLQKLAIFKITIDEISGKSGNIDCEALFADPESSAL